LTELGPGTIFFWNDFDGSLALRVSTTNPPLFYDQGINPNEYQVVYFMKRRWDRNITEANLQDCVLFKTLSSDPLEDLLAKMNGEYVKKLLQENDWPDGVKKEFIANLHKFMAFLNETTYAARGQTYLYIPDEDLSDIEAAAKDKDLLQRLESTVIHWTRLIKELVSNQDSPTNQQIESPLDEIQYW
jgi:dynein heavy chain